MVRSRSPFGIVADLESMKLIILTVLVFATVTCIALVSQIRLPSFADRAIHRYGRRTKPELPILLAIAATYLAATPLFCHFGIGQSGALHCHALPDRLTHVH